MTTRDHPEAARRRLGEIVEKARLAAGLAQKAVSNDEETYKRLRDGRPVRPATLRRAEEALGWATFAADDILDGAAEPRLATPGEPRDEHAMIVRRAYEQAGEIMEGMAGATPEERQQIAEILARARARSRTRPN